MKKVLFIVGPTSVGKTSLAVKISKEIPSILISADSVQVYRSADIISGKDHPKGLQIELIDTVSPFDNFSVHDFVEKVRPIVRQALEHKKIPIIVGGTGFYLDALFGKIDTLSTPPDRGLREKLGKKTVRQLQQELARVDSNRFEKMNNSERNNPRRLTRAIEVALFQAFTSSKVRPFFKPSDVLIVGLRTSMEDLRKRIENRVRERLKNGALAEAKKLFKDYGKLSPQIKSANGYHQLFQHLLGEITFDQAIQGWIIADYHHAKNQITWFKKNKNIVWFESKNRDSVKEVLKLIKMNFNSIDI